MLKLLNSKPTQAFLLRGVNPEKVYNDYIEGGYKTSSLVGGCDTYSSCPVSEESITVSSNSLDEIYIAKNKNNVTQTICTTNHVNMIRWIKTDGEGDTIPSTFLCGYCKRKYSGDVLGLPIKMEKTNPNVTVVYYSEAVCTYNCALSLAIFRYGAGGDHRYSESEKIVRHLFHSQYPGCKLTEAKDPQLLNENGGPLTNEEYDDPSYNYIRTSHLIWAPVKMNYLRLRNQYT